MKIWEEEDIKKVVLMARSGHRLKDIADAVGRTQKGVAFRLQKQGYMNAKLRQELKELDNT